MGAARAAWDELPSYLRLGTDELAALARSLARGGGGGRDAAGADLDHRLADRYALPVRRSSPISSTTPTFDRNDRHREQPTEGLFVPPSAELLVPQPLAPSLPDWWVMWSGIRAVRWAESPLARRTPSTRGSSGRDRRRSGAGRSNRAGLRRDPTVLRAVRAVPAERGIVVRAGSVGRDVNAAVRRYVEARRFEVPVFGSFLEEDDDHPAGPQPADGPRRPHRHFPVPGPRPRRPVHHLVRRRPRQRRHRHREDPTTLSASELLRRRFVRTARTELTDRILIFGEHHLRTVLARYAAHCNGQRPHRALQLRSPHPDHPALSLSCQRIRRRPVLGGLISEYERAA
jgi:hypothetical protein